MLGVTIYGSTLFGVLGVNLGAVLLFGARGYYYLGIKSLFGVRGTTI